MTITLGEKVTFKVGFGFEKDPLTKKYIIPPVRRPHNYDVVIGDNVEIDDFVVIEKGRKNDTVIGDGTKIDSFSLIGHNTVIGKYCFIIAAKIGGSVTIGDECFIGLNSTIKDGITIVNNVTVGCGSNVINNILDPHTTWAGNPAKQIHDYQTY